MTACSIGGCAKDSRARGMCKMHYERWRKHGDPSLLLIRPDGQGCVTSLGYVAKKKDGVTTLEHVSIAEMAIGKRLPQGACVHHIDEDKANNAPSNLVVCPSQGYHSLLHIRQKALDAGKPANYRKCGYCHQFDDPLSMVMQQIGPHGRYYHRECRRAYDARRNYGAERAARRESKR